MAWAFRTNVPTPNLDRKLLFPLALFSPIYTLRDLYTLVHGIPVVQRPDVRGVQAYDARRLGTRFEVPYFLFRARPM
jgi:hypothetical protein